MEAEVAELVGAERLERPTRGQDIGTGWPQSWDYTGRHDSSRKCRKCGPAATIPRFCRRGAGPNRHCGVVKEDTYVHRVSTRKVDELVKTLGLDRISKS